MPAILEDAVKSIMKENPDMKKGQLTLSLLNNFKNLVILKKVLTQPLKRQASW